MTDLSKLIEEMEAAGEGRVTGPWRVEDGELITVHEGGVSSYVLRTFPSAVGPTLNFIAFAGTHWQRILEALKQAQAENERLRGTLEQISNGEGRYGAQAFEYKQIARQALTKEPSSDQ